MKINLNKNRFYSIIIVLIATLFPLIHYPVIYGTDAFDIIWMANAIRNGALFSENTWLIHPTSYFGYYPFSHRPIGIPIFIAFLVTFFDFISFGIFGLAEVILVFDFLLIILIYKSAKNLGNQLFKENWSRFLFVISILLSFYTLESVTMTISTRIIITMVMILLLNLNLKVLNKSIKIHKFIILTLLFLIVSALSHKLWLVLPITIILLIFVIITRKYEKFQKLIITFIIPIAILLFFIGLNIFSNISYDFFYQSEQTFEYFKNLNSLFSIEIFLSWFYVWNIGIILLFFPIGVIITLYKTAKQLKKHNITENQLGKFDFLQKYYLLLLLIPFSFLLSATYYSIVLIFPILVIFSVYGIIFIREILSSYSEIFRWLLLIIMILISVGYTIVKMEVSTKIDIWYVFLLLIIVFTLIFIILASKILRILEKKYKLLNFNRVIHKIEKMKNLFWTIMLLISISIFSITTIETNRVGLCNKTYPWENLCLTQEEIKIIEFFESRQVNGLILTMGITSIRIASVGGLPALSRFGTTYFGIVLWDGLITSEQVHQMAKFSLFQLIDLQFYITVGSSRERFPILYFYYDIIKLNITIPNDRIILRDEYNVEYIIVVKQGFLEEADIEMSGTTNVLIRSLYHSNLDPIFSTNHLFIYEITT